MNEQIGHCNCVLLRDDAEDVSASLIREAQQRRWRVESVGNAHEAFARLCLHERLEAARSAWGLQRHTPPVLVIDAALPNAQFSELIGACEQYVPGIGIWQWTRDALEELRAAAPPAQTDAKSGCAGQSAHTATDAMPRRRSFNGPMLRLHEPPDAGPRTAGQAGDASDPTDDDRPEHRGQALSADEIHMLLGTEEEPSPS